MGKRGKPGGPDKKPPPKKAGNGASGGGGSHAKPIKAPVWKNPKGGKKK